MKLLNEKEVAQLTGRAVQTLRNDRFLGRGIPYIKYARSVRYMESDVIEDIRKRRVQTREQ